MTHDSQTLIADAARIADLESALRQARAAIMKAAEDTLWCEDSPAETVVDRIDAVLGGETETGELFPSLPSPPVSGLEWDTNSLLYRGEHIGHLTYWTSDQIPNNWNYQFLENMGPSYTLTASEAKSELERRARAWLSPITNEPVGVTFHVSKMECSNGDDYFVMMQTARGPFSMFKFKERYKAEYQTAELNWIIGNGQRPELWDYTAETHPNDPLSASITGEKG